MGSARSGSSRKDFWAKSDKIRNISDFFTGGRKSIAEKLFFMKSICTIY